MTIAEIEAVLAGVNAVAGQIQPLIPVVVGGLKALFALWRKDNPDGTEEDFIGHLASKGAAVEEFTANWLTSKGYTQDPATGTWTPPGGEPVV
jgi:hypothetical protein